MLKEFKCSELAALVGGKASSGNIIVDNISSLESAKTSSISFLSDSSYISKLKETKSKVILIKKDDLKYWKKDYILVKNPYLAFSKIATLFSELGENDKHPYMNLLFLVIIQNLKKIMIFGHTPSSEIIAY